MTIGGATPLSVHVSSDPLQADSDGDGISDQAERQLSQSADPAKQIDDQGVPYNPNVVNTPPIKVYTDTDKHYIRPGQTLAYTTTVVASDALAPSALDVNAPAALGGSPAPYALPFNPLTFSGAQTVTQQTNFSAQPGLGTQTVAINSSVQGASGVHRAVDLELGPVLLPAARQHRAGGSLRAASGVAARPAG